VEKGRGKGYRIRCEQFLVYELYSILVGYARMNTRLGEKRGRPKRRGEGGDSCRRGA